MEEDIKVQVCRLCFSLISDKSFSNIKDSIKDMLKVITTDLDLDITDSPVMCLECLKSLQEIFNFKTNFFESEEKIDSKIVNVKHKKLNLRDIMNEAFNKKLKRKSTRANNNKLCRTCLEEIEGNAFISLKKNTDEYLSPMLDSCLPELDLKLTSDPVMCQTCYKTVQKMRDFKSMCNKNESQIEAYLMRICSNVPKKVNIHSVLQFVYNLGTKSDVHDDVEVKKEPVECEGEVKNEENLYSGEEHYELNDCSQYVLVKMEANEEFVTRQVKREVKEESGVENCLEDVMIKMEPTDNDDGIDHIEPMQSDDDLKDSFITTTKHDFVKVKSKDKLNSCRSRSIRYSNRIKQNEVSNRSEENSIMQCSDCDFKTKYKYNLRRHLVIFHKRKDMEKRFYQCDKCDFATKWNIDLTRHMLSHVKPEALQCSRCAFTTNQNSLLIKHILSHVNAENIDKYSFLQLLKKAQ